MYDARWAPPPDLCSLANGRKVCSSSRRSVHTWLILHCHVSLKLLMYQLQTMGGIRIRFRSAREHRTICVELDGGLVVSDNNRTNRMPHAMYHSSAGHSFLIVRWDPLSGNCRHANCWGTQAILFLRDITSTYTAVWAPCKAPTGVPFKQAHALNT